ncbi:MAG: glycoside hydrolase family 2 TIM barrel-domain containing protein [Candidatus Omnitrophica bacterium]|nr:glycoside hydrolase family 2 TIM barrel-domain containing protein [Candidatus Omnitrophota bacterium]
MTSKDLIEKSWEAHGKRDAEKTLEYTGQCIELYAKQAQEQQSSLNAMPKEGTPGLQELNDVAVAYFIQGEVHMRDQEWEKAKAALNIVLDKYKYAWGWDPRGWFWSVTEKARDSITKINKIIRGDTGEEGEEASRENLIPIALHDPGADVVDYEKYGEFKGAGTRDYKYIVKDQEGLSMAAGEGIHPNTSSHRFDQRFITAVKEGKVKQGLHWQYMNSPDLQTAFFNWIIAAEPAGVKLFYIGELLEKSGLIKHALKAYHAIAVHFPGSYGWTYWHTPWYVGQTALAKIESILRGNPDLNLRLEGAYIKILNGFDNDISNDIVITDPGRFIKVNLTDKIFSRKSAKDIGVSRALGKGKVRLVQYQNSHWQLLVDGSPYMIKGITYAPTRVGQSPDEGTLGNWMTEDSDKNGRIDGPYDSFVDENGNNKQDAGEPAVGDFQLMKEMGVNTIRLYHHPLKISKELLRDMYNRYGIRVIIGDFLGKYAIGSNAEWAKGTDYANPEHKKNMLASVRRMVEEFKDEPYVLMWLLGNENVYGVACNADKNPKAFFQFANEAALMIKSMDADHPVALCNGDTLFLDAFAKYAADIDIFSANAYRGSYGFGSLWSAVKELADKPAFISEYGCPAYAKGRSLSDAEGLQAEYHRGCWQDIENNTAFSEGAGNSLGGIVFEWLDEWWKAYEPFIHDRQGLFTGPFPDGYMHEEWLGVCGQGSGALSPFLRHLRKSYFLYRDSWLRDEPWEFKDLLSKH